MDAESLARKVLQFFDNHYGEEYSEKNLVKKMGFRDTFSKTHISQVLQKLVASGTVSKNPRNEFSSTRDTEFIVGKVDYVN